MSYIIEGLKGAAKIILSLDKEFLGIIGVSLKISLTSTFLAGLVGIPLGICIGTSKFKGRKLINIVLNTLMAFPTVVIGLMVYSFLSRSGPLGKFGLLFTPTAMIIGQFILALPIISALSAAGTRNIGEAPLIAARILGADRKQSFMIFLKETRLLIISCLLAGFGRVFAEVGVSMMLGGNIRFYTRNITTAIALETSKGYFSLGIALGIVLLAIAFIINIVVFLFHHKDL